MSMADVLVSSLALSQDDLALHQILQTILQLCEEEDDGGDRLVAAGVFSQCGTLLAAHRCCEGKVAQLIAELAKDEDTRVPGGKSGIIPHLIDGLDDGNRDVVCQSLRAIANLCFNCDDSRNAVLKASGAEKLSNCLDSLLRSNGHDAELLRVLCGTTLNLATEHKEAAIALVSAGIVKKLVDVVAIREVPESVHEMALNALDNITESGECQSCLADVEVVQTLKTALNGSPSSTIQERIMEVLATVANTDDGKKVLVEGSVCDSLLDIIKTHLEGRSGDEVSDRKMDVAHKAADLINLVLTGDESMVMLFNEGCGRVVTDAIHWLTQSDDKLIAAGSLAIGNCARNDQNCQRLFDLSVVNKLISLMRSSASESHKQETVEQQHSSIAILSTLRNFSIPATLKSEMVSCGVVDVAIHSMQSINPAVQFKSLAILRLLVDGQSHVACHVGETEGVLTRIVELSGTDFHSGLKAESGRLLAALVKHCHSKGIMQTVAECGGVRCLVGLGQSDHPVMIHEAVVALTIMVTTLGEESLSVWIESEVIPLSLDVVRNKSMTVEIRANTLTLLWSVSQLGGAAVEELKRRGMSDLLHQLNEESEGLFQDMVGRLQSLNL